MQPRSRFSLALIGACIYFTLVVSASWNSSATYDEPAHIYSGYLCLFEGRFDVNNFHPPLTKMMAVLPLTWSPPSYDSEFLDTHRRDMRTDELAAVWFWNNSLDPQTMLRRCRLSLNLFQAFLVGGCLYLLSGTAGVREAAAFSMLAFLSPPVLGLSGFVITDVSNSLFILLVLLSFQKMVKVGTRSSFVLFTLCLFGGISTKHSFLLLPAVLGGICVGGMLYARYRKITNTWSAVLAKLALAVALSFLSTLALYGFCIRNMDSGNMRSYFESSQRHVPYMSLIVDRPVLYPLGFYSTGISRTLSLVQDGKYKTNLASKVYKGGDPVYFPSLLLVKEAPLIILLLLLLPLWNLVKKRRPVSPLLAISAFAFSGCYFAVAVAGSVNIGFRHILPTYLTLLLTISLLRGWRREVLVMVLAVRLFSLVTTFPHYLAYFNDLSGGVEKGYEFSVISDADWSQDFLRLRHYMEDKGGKVFVYPASPIDPEYYLGEYYQAPGSRPVQTGDLIAVSTTFLKIPSFLEGAWSTDVAKISTYPKEHQIGGSIVIYRVP